MHHHMLEQEEPQYNKEACEKIRSTKETLLTDNLLRG